MHMMLAHHRRREALGLPLPSVSLPALSRAEAGDLARQWWRAPAVLTVKTSHDALRG